MLTDAPQSQLDLFDARLPRRPYCTDALEAGLRIRDPQRASQARYIQANPPWLRSWILMDLDAPGAVMAWDHAHLPEPAWAAQNPANSHAHLAWGLDAPVLLGQHDRAQPMRYLAAVESAMRAKLAPYGADSGYSGLITKNPRNRAWRVFWGRSLYDLPELQDWLDLDKHQPKRGSKPETAGLGRNVSTFDHVRFAAYPSVRQWRYAGSGAYIHWLNWLYRVALDFTANEHPVPLDNKECHWIARSVAHWVWTRFDADESDRRFSAKQSARGRKKGASRRGWMLPIAQSMAAEGWSQSDIARDLGLTQQTVSNWLRRPDAYKKP